MRPFNLIEINEQIHKSFTLTTVIAYISTLVNKYTNDYALEIEFDLDAMYIISKSDKFLQNLVEIQILAFIRRLAFDYNCKYKSFINNGIIIS